MRRSLLLFLLLVLVACGGDSSGPDTVSLDGSWSGMNAGITTTLLLAESHGHVTGNGNMTNGSTSVAITADGTFDPPNFSFTISATGFQDFDYSGTATSQHMKGRFNGSGFVNVLVVLDKE